MIQEVLIHRKTKEPTNQPTNQPTGAFRNKVYIFIAIDPRFTLTRRATIWTTRLSEFKNDERSQLQY